MTTGERIRKVRKERGITQGQLCEILGYTNKASISQIEKGQWKPSLDVVVRIADALGTTPQFLLGWTDSTGVPGEVLYLMGKMSTEQQLMVKSFAEWVLKGESHGI